MTVVDCVTVSVPIRALAVTVAVTLVIDDSEVKETATTPVELGVDVVTVLVPLSAKVPALVTNVTDVPAGTGSPELSLIIAMMPDELIPSAAILAGLAVRVMDPITLTRGSTSSAKLPFSAWALISTSPTMEPE